MPIAKITEAIKSSIESNKEISLNVESLLENIKLDIEHLLGKGCFLAPMFGDHEKGNLGDLTGINIICEHGENIPIII